MRPAISLLVLLLASLGAMHAWERPVSDAAPLTETHVEMETETEAASAFETRGASAPAVTPGRLSAEGGEGAPRGTPPTPPPEQ